jgi:ankyrin repeat protein
MAKTTKDTPRILGSLSHKWLIKRFAFRYGLKNLISQYAKSKNEADITKLQNFLSTEKDVLGYEDTLNQKSKASVHDGKKINKSAAEIILNPNSKIDLKSRTILINTLSKHGAKLPQTVLFDVVSPKFMDNSPTEDLTSGLAVSGLITELKKQGANPNVQLSTNGSSPLHLAVSQFDRQRSAQIVSALKEIGANISLTDSKMNTPAHIAISRMPKITDLSDLVDQKVMRQQNNLGENPLHTFIQQIKGGKVAEDLRQKTLTLLLDNSSQDTLQQRNSKNQTSFELAATLDRKIAPQIHQALLETAMSKDPIVASLKPVQGPANAPLVINASRGLLGFMSELTPIESMEKGNLQPILTAIKDNPNIEVTRNGKQYPLFYDLIKYSKVKDKQAFAEQLIRAGADPFATTKDGKSALYHLDKAGTPEAKELSSFVMDKMLEHRQTKLMESNPDLLKTLTPEAAIKMSPRNQAMLLRTLSAQIKDNPDMIIDRAAAEKLQEQQTKLNDIRADIDAGEQGLSQRKEQQILETLNSALQTMNPNLQPSSPPPPIPSGPDGIENVLAKAPVVTASPAPVLNGGKEVKIEVAPAGANPVISGVEGGGVANAAIMAKKGASGLDLNAVTNEQARQRLFARQPRSYVENKSNSATATRPQDSELEVIQDLGSRMGIQFSGAEASKIFSNAIIAKSVSKVVEINDGSDVLNPALKLTGSSASSVTNGVEEGSQLSLKEALAQKLQKTVELDLILDAGSSSSAVKIESAPAISGASTFISDVEGDNKAKENLMAAIRAMKRDDQELDLKTYSAKTTTIVPPPPPPPGFKGMYKPPALEQQNVADAAQTLNIVQGGAAPLEGYKSKAQNSALLDAIRKPQTDEQGLNISGASSDESVTRAVIKGVASIVPNALSKSDDVTTDPVGGANVDQPAAEKTARPSLGNLLSEIQGGAELKKVEPAKQEQRPVSPRDAMLAAIQKGGNLQSAAPSEKDYLGAVIDKLKEFKSRAEGINFDDDDSAKEKQKQVEFTTDLKVFKETPEFTKFLEEEKKAPKSLNSGIIGRRDAISDNEEDEVDALLKRATAFKSSTSKQSSPSTSRSSSPAQSSPASPDSVIVDAQLTKAQGNYVGKNENSAMAAALKARGAKLKKVSIETKVSENDDGYTSSDSESSSEKLTSSGDKALSTAVDAMVAKMTPKSINFEELHEELDSIRNYDNPDDLNKFKSDPAFQEFVAVAKQHGIEVVPDDIEMQHIDKLQGTVLQVSELSKKKRASSIVSDITSPSSTPPASPNVSRKTVSGNIGGPS